MRYVFFTGATGGLGEICVKALSDKGDWTVFAAGTNDDALKRLSLLPRVIPIKADITSMESLEAALQAVQKHTDSLQAVVNFAGLSSFAPLIEGDIVREIQRILDVNVVGAARVNRVFFEMILKGRGRIINCSSESGWMSPQPFAGAYVLSKHALEAYNDSLRRELMLLGIPVTKIQPGSYKTRLTAQVSDSFEQVLSRTQYFRKALQNMKPLMDMELNKGNDPIRLAKTVIRAMEAPKPRLSYRVGTGKLLALMELLPERGVDLVYRLILKK